MDTNNGLPLVAPRVIPVLDPGFRPGVLAAHGFRALVDQSSGAVPVRLALEQSDGSVFRFDIRVLPETHRQASGNLTFVERLIKFLLWSRGGWRIYIDGPGSIAAHLASHYRHTATGRFDAHLVAQRMFDHPLQVVHTRDLPPEHSETRPLGRHLDGCRIGFDLGGSDRKVAALIDGTRGLQRRDGLGSVLQARSAVPLRRHHGLAGQGRGASSARGRDWRQRRGRLREQSRQGRVAVSRRSRGRLQYARADCFSRSARRGTTCPSKWSTMARSPRSPARCRSGRTRSSASPSARARPPVTSRPMGTSPRGSTNWRSCPSTTIPAAPVDEWSGDYGVGAQYFSQQCVGAPDARGRHRLVRRTCRCLSG